MRSFYVTTPIYYVNANPHLGHAYTTIVADAITRLHKMLGEKTLFLTGTDEHGDKIVQAAEKRNLSPSAFVDEISSHFMSLWPKLSTHPDRFTRTTARAHKKAVQDFLQRIYDAGDIYFGEFGGYYCYGCERFYTEKELENGLCPQHLSKPQFISEKNYFFRMSRYLPWLREFLAAHPDLIRPERYFREAMAMLEGEVLEDLCISRPKSRLQWGIELPFDANYVCYVWFDALLSYISGIGWPEGGEFREFWPGEHIVAKDILKPHAIFWPCMLKAAGLPIYRHLNVHGYWLSRDTKMSKSLGNVIEPLAMSEKFGLDAFRYFLLREMHFGSDASFGEESLVTRVNADLANDLGNLFSRVLSMNAKYFQGKVCPVMELSPEDRSLLEAGQAAMTNYLQLFEKMDFAHALEALWQYIRMLNKYVDSQAPWALFRAGDEKRLGTVINFLLASMRKIALLLWPAMPDAAGQMLAQLGQKECAALAQAGNAPTTAIEEEIRGFDPLEPGAQLAQSSNLFPRILKDEKKQEKKKNEGKIAPSPDANAEQSPVVGIDAFNMLDIRVGTIQKAQKHPNADRILVCDVDFGPAGCRQILSGLAEYYSPEELAGKKVCAILNLAPRKIRGLESRGMILTVESQGRVTLLGCDPGMDNGSKIC